MAMGAKTEALITGMAAQPLDAGIVSFLVEDGMECSQEAFTGWIELMREEDYVTELTHITVPTLIVQGKSDPIRTEDTLRTEVADRIAGSTLVTLPGVGHLMHLEDPHALAVILINFLDTLP